jgi:serine/threonine protein kinase
MRDYERGTREVSDVTSGPIGPGTLLAGRYRLDDLLTESEGARFWRATDTILARSVAIHAVPSDDPRAPGLLEAARVSATVTDPHLLRVLDCDDDNGITWVVNEWGEGISLDLMLQQGTLPPSRAAWLAREVAEAIAAGHAQGVAHGRLNPEAVLVTHAGAVKLIGYVVDASLDSPRPPDPLYGELDEREADVINLAGILYAALTGRWPGVAHSEVPRAPRESRRPLRPRQVRAGVPRTLDAICERVLHKEGSLHSMPIETAHEIAAALADYVGDPALTAPPDAAGMHAEPTVSINRDALPAGLPDFGPGFGPSAAVPADVEPEDVQREGDTDSHTVVGPEEDPAAHDPDATQIAVPLSAQRDPRTTGPVADPEVTQAFRPPSDGPDSLAPMHPPATEGSPPPLFPDVPERPLFASTERRVPSAARTGALTQSPWGEPEQGTSGTQTSGGPGWPGTGDTGRHGTTPSGGSDPGYWPFTGEPEEHNEVHTGKEGRGWLRTAIVIGVLLVLVVAMAIAFSRGRQDGSSSAGPGSEPSTTPQPTGTPIKLVGAKDFDPLADPPEENPESAPNAIDGDPATSWVTSTYRGDPELGGLKPGVGLIVDLGSEKQPRSVTVRFKGAPTSFEVYAAPAGVDQYPDSLDQLDKVATSADAPERATVKLDPTPKTRYVLVWLTRLPAVSGGFRGEIVDISVRS